MKGKEQPSEAAQKILYGLEKAYEKLVAFKRYKNSPLIVSRDGKIVEIPPEDIPITSMYQRSSKGSSHEKGK